MAEQDQDFESFLQSNSPAPADTGAGAPSAPAPAPVAATGPGADSFESFLTDQKSQHDASVKSQAQGISTANSQQSADSAGRAASTGRQIGVPGPVVETDPERYEQQAKAQNNASILNANPKLASWVVDNPFQAKISQDQYQDMANMGDVLSGSGVLDFAKNLAKGVAGSIVNSGLAINRGIAQGIANQTGYQPTQQEFQSDWWYKNMIAPQLGNQAATALSPDASFGAKAVYTVGGMLGTLAQIAATGGAAEVPEAAAAVPTAAQAIGQQIAHGARAMAFPALTEALTAGKDAYDKTGDTRSAILAATTAYGTATLGGVVPLGAEGSLATRAATGFLSGAVTGEVSRQAQNLVNPEQQPFNPEQTILSGLSGSILAGAMGRSPLHDAVRQAYSDGIDAETAQRGAAAVQQVSDISTASKLREHDPEAFRDYVARMAEDGPIENVYIDGQTFADALHQSAVDPDQVPGLNDRLAEATLTGGDVQIPIADYATHIAGTDLDKAIQPELKAEEGGMTFSEGQKYFDTAQQEMQARAEELVKSSEPQTQQDQDVKQIGDTLFEQLKATGRYPDDVARASLAPVTEFYRTMAERTGQTPGELYKQFPLKIAGENPAEGALEQPARGGFAPDSNTIGLLKDADLSTFLHESGHFFLSTLGDLAGRADAPGPIRDDMQTAISWMGGKDLADWQSKTLEEQRDMHEKFARGFETYLMEGKAPSLELQGLFSRFRSWLINVYRSVSGLGADLSPEVRGVFDRLLASDDAIRQAESLRGYANLDLSKTDATEKQQANYAALGDKATQDALDEMAAKSINDVKWQSGAKSRALKKLQREANAQRDLIHEESMREVNESPVEKARQFVAANDFKTTDSMQMDLTAEQFGIGSGAELVDGLSVDPKAKIDALTDQRMLERHGELIDPQAIEDAANAAIANDARARHMATGLKLLSKSPIPARDLAKAATDSANTVIAAKRVSDVNPRQFEVAEAKANKEAIDQAPKNPAEAVKAQRQALLSNRLAKAARDAVADIKKIVDSQKRYDNDSIRSKMDPDILDQIDALRDRFDFRQKPPAGPTKAETSLQTWIDSQKDLLYSPTEVADMLNPAVRMHYKDMTVEQLRGFNDTIRSMEQIARARKTVTIEGKKVDLDQIVSELKGKLIEAGEKFTEEELLNPVKDDVNASFWNRQLARITSVLRSSFAEFKPQQFKANQFDLHELGGPFTKAIFQRMFDANYHKIDMTSEASKAFRGVALDLGREWQDSLDRLVPNNILVDADLKNGGFRKLTRGEMLGIARHVGNESNFDKLTNGMEWKAEDVRRFLEQNMIEKDWNATQSTWDIMSYRWPEILEMSRRLGNSAPDQIEPRGFKIWTTGDDGQPKQISLRGGHAPIDYDPNPSRSKRAAKSEQARAVNPSEGLAGKEYYRSDVTTNGSLNSRVAGYYDRLDLGYHSLERRLHDSIHDLAYREATIDVHKILANREFASQFRSTYGPESYKSLNRWLGDLVNGGNRDDPAAGFINSALELGRHGALRLGIAFRLSTVLKHGGSAAAKSSGYFTGGGMKYLMSRATQIGTDRDGQISSAIEKFPEIRARAMQQDRDYKQTTSSMFEPESKLSKMDRAGHATVAYMDLMSAVPTAWAAYDRAITEGIPKNRGGTGKPMNEDDAVQYANQVVREAHGSNIESARSMVMNERNEAIKAVTTLYGFMNNSLGQTMDLIGKTGVKGYSKPELFARLFGTLIVPALITGALEKPDKAESLAAWAAKAITGEVAGMVPLVRDVIGYAMHPGATAFQSPLGKAVTDIGKAGHDVVKLIEGKPVKSPIKDIGNAIGLGIPGMGQAGTTLQYAADLKSGKVKPQGPVDVVRGLALGQNNQ